jgi:hypothetical protein
MLMHSVALRAPSDTDRSASADSTRLNTLLSTLEAGKRFLDALLSHPAHDYHLITFSEWMRLPTVIMTVAKLCMPNDAHTAVGWDIKAAQDRVRLDLCLESLCYRMQQLSTYDKVKQRYPDFWHSMRWINDLTKAWYMRRIKPYALSQPTPSGSTGQTETGWSNSTPGALPTPSTDQGCPSLGMGAGMDDMDMSGNADDPFAFMKDMDIDMEQLFEMGNIFSDEAYTGMGFGGGMPF